MNIRTLLLTLAFLISPGALRAEPETQAISPRVLDAGGATAEAATEEAVASESAVEPPIPQTDDKMVAQPGNLRDTLTKSIPLFVPSEEIDVDKPVDFPTNI